MAGCVAPAASERREMALVAVTVRDQWEVQFARFFKFPSNTSSFSLLISRPNSRRFNRSTGTWISSSSSSGAASLLLINAAPTSDLLLSVHFQGRVCEEHFVSQLHFSRPQVSCLSGFPARGSRAVLASYIDSEGELQKFALRFSTNCEADAFIDALKVILKDGTDTVFPCSDFRSEISSQSEFMSSNRPLYRTQEDLSMTTPVSVHTPMPQSMNYEADQHSQPEYISSARPTYRPEDRSSIVSALKDYSPQMPANMNYKVEQHSHRQQAGLNHNYKDIHPALPPSFSTLLTNCFSEAELAAAQQSMSGEVELKSQIMKYMEDSSFHDMLSKVERVINELGDDLSLDP